MSNKQKNKKAKIINGEVLNCIDLGHSLDGVWSMRFFLYLTPSLERLY